MLRAVGKGTSAKQVAALRATTAELIEQAWHADEEVNGISVQTMVMNAGVSLHAYLHHLRHRLWASEVELHYAARALGIAVLFKDGKRITALGSGKIKGVVVLRKAHYTLHKSHAKVTKKLSHTSIGRAGMRALEWTSWQPQQDQQNPIQVQIKGQDQAVVVVSSSPTVDILKAKLATMFDVDLDLVTLMDKDEDEYPDWVQCPPIVIAQIGKQEPRTIPLLYEGLRVDLWVANIKDEQSIRREIGKLFNVIPALLHLRVGSVKWAASMTLNEDEVVTVTVCARGGMQNTVSTTLRWDEGSGSSSESPIPRYLALHDKCHSLLLKTLALSRQTSSCYHPHQYTPSPTRTRRLCMYLTAKCPYMTHQSMSGCSRMTTSSSLTIWRHSP